MKFVKIAIIIFLVALFAAACNDTTGRNQTPDAVTRSTPAVASPQAAPAGTPVDELAAARTTYSAACAKCHQENGEGGSVELDEGGTLKVPSFKRARSVKHTDEQFARQIANGGDGMPAFKSRLTAEQVNELVRFVRREFQSGVAAKEDASGKNASGRD